MYIYLDTIFIIILITETGKYFFSFLNIIRLEFVEDVVGLKRS